MTLLGYGLPAFLYSSALVPSISASEYFRDFPLIEELQRRITANVLFLGQVGLQSFFVPIIIYTRIPYNCQLTAEFLLEFPRFML